MILMVYDWDQIPNNENMNAIMVPSSEGSDINFVLLLIWHRTLANLTMIFSSGKSLTTEQQRVSFYSMDPLDKFNSKTAHSPHIDKILEIHWLFEEKNMRKSCFIPFRVIH